MLSRQVVWVLGAVLYIGSAGSAWSQHVSGGMGLLAAVPDRGARRAGELIVRYKQNTVPSRRAVVRAKVGGSVLRDLGYLRAERLRLQGGDVDDAIARLRSDPAVEYAEPNYVWSALGAPDDSLFSRLWGMQNTGQTGGIPGADIRATQAWDVFTGDPELRIGVIDSGVDYTHPDLAANIWTNPGEIPGNGIDDDGNGYVDDVHGYDFVHDDGDPFDDYAHGTHMAGTIAAVGNNGIGVAGVNWHARIVAIKVLDETGHGSTDGILAALGYAIAVGVRVTNNSWGHAPYSQSMLDAINAAGAAGQLFVAAAGNTATDNDANPMYPASFDTPYVLAVAATNDRDSLAYFSNTGATSVDLGAPGLDIVSTIPGGRYASGSGTSMATPHVTGAVAFTLGRFPGITALQAKSMILAHVDPLPALEGRVASGGRLNLYATEPDSVPPAPIVDLHVVEPGSSTMRLSWTAAGDDGSAGRARRYDLRFNVAPITEATFAMASPATARAPRPSGQPDSAEVAGLGFDTPYHFAIKAVDEMGNAGPISNVVVGTTLGVPDITVAPANLDQTQSVGTSGSQTLSLRNDGQGTLDFVIPDPDPMFIEQAVHAYVPLDKGATDTRPGITSALGAGGPDPFGYRWIDSDDPNGPSFQWIDITQVGQRVPLTGDDAISGAIPIRMNFPFYGRTYSSLRVCTNGFITFLGFDSPYTNQPLPNSGAPRALIAPFWDDLVMPGLQVYTRFDGARFIVSWIGAFRHYAGGPHSFQVILYPSGEIRFQYLSLQSLADEYTVGVQNDARNTGLTTAFNAHYLHDRLAVQIYPDRHWLEVAPRAGRVRSGEEARLTAQFDASALRGGDYTSSLRVLSNDPDEATVLVPVRLHAIGPPDPDIGAVPAQIDAGVEIPAAETRHVTISNDGPGDLSFNLTPVYDRSDRFGYRWVDSDNVYGPNFDWVDITGVGEEVPISGGAMISAPIPMRMSVPFYEETFWYVQVCTNGYATFSGSTAPDENDPIPSTGAPHYLLAPFWDDLNMSTGRAYTYFDGSRFIVSWIGLGHSNPVGGPYSFQAILYPSGEIVYQYLYMGGPNDQATVGIQNGRGDDGLMAAFNTRYVHNGLAVSFRRTPSWLRVTPSLGVVPPGQTADLQFAINTAGLIPDVYRSSVEFLSNDPDEPLIDVGVVLTAGLRPDIATSPAVLDFGRVFVGQQRRLPMALSNTGTGVLSLAGIRIANGSSPAFQIEPGRIPTTLGPGRRDTLRLRFAPTAACSMCVGSLEISSDDPDENPLVVPLAGSGVEPALIDVTPDSLIESLLIDHTADRTLEISNPGRGALDWSISAQATETWLSIDPSSGSMGPGQGGQVTVRLDATGLVRGDYASDLVVTSNAATRPQFSLPVRLHVAGIPDIAIEGAADSLAFGVVFVGTCRTETLSVRNRGNDVLQVTSIEASSPTFTVTPSSAAVSKGESTAVVVQFCPDAPVPVDATLTLHCNDPDTPTVTRALHGVGLLPPDIRVTPAEVTAWLEIPSSAIRHVSIHNDGGVDLSFSLNVATRSWLSVTPSSGRVPPGQTADVQFAINTTGLLPDIYRSTVEIASNDLDTPRIDVGVTVSAGLRPDIAVSPAALDFGRVYLGQQRRLPIVLSNTGTGVLALAGVRIANGSSAAFQIESGATPTTLGPGQRDTLTLRFAPIDACSTCVGSLEISSDDPDESPIPVTLSGWSLPPPALRVTPDSLRAAAATTLGPTALVRMKRLTIRNVGTSELRFQSFGQTSQGAVQAYASLDLPRDAADPRAGFLGYAGPDRYGYGWRDGDAPDGPGFEWVDLTTVTAPIDLTGDDAVSGPVYLGMVFPFYGRRFESVFICTNGFLSFTDPRDVFVNQPLPSPGAPSNLIAPFWDDLVVDVPSVYAHFDGDRFIVSWVGVRSRGGYGPYSFQALLYPSGEIRFQYRDLDPFVSGATIGIQNASGNDGLTVAFNHAYLRGGLATRLALEPRWVSVEPAGGSVAPGDSMALEVRVDATNLTAGDYIGAVEVASNDPLRMVGGSVPFRLHVGVRAASFDIDPTLSTTSDGRCVMGEIELPVGIDPRTVVTSSMLVQREIRVAPESLGCGSDPYPSDDRDHDGLREVRFWVDRKQQMDRMSVGDAVPVEVIGEIGDVTWFRGIDLVRERPSRCRPEPRSGDVYAVGSTVPFQWADPYGVVVTSRDLWLTTDDGDHWEPLALGIRSGGYPWTVPARPTDRAMLGLVTTGVNGILGTWLSERFGIAPATPVLAPDHFGLRALGASPARGTVVLELAIPSTAGVELSVFDVRGRVVTWLVNRSLEPGWQRVVWDARDGSGARIPPGIYFARMRAGGKTFNTRLAMLR